MNRPAAPASRVLRSFSAHALISSHARLIEGPGCGRGRCRLLTDELRRAQGAPTHAKCFSLPFIDLSLPHASAFQYLSHAGRDRPRADRPGRRARAPRRSVRYANGLFPVPFAPGLVCGWAWACVLGVGVCVGRVLGRGRGRGQRQRVRRACGLFPPHSLQDGTQLQNRTTKSHRARVSLNPPPCPRSAEEVRAAAPGIAAGWRRQQACAPDRPAVAARERADGGTSRRRDCHFAYIPCLSILKHLLMVQVGAIK